jgi:hypothetical protein
MSLKNMIKYDQTESNRVMWWKTWLLAVDLFLSIYQKLLQAYLLVELEVR